MILSDLLESFGNFSKFSDFFSFSMRFRVFRGIHVYIAIIFFNARFRGLYGESKYMTRNIGNGGSYTQGSRQG